MCLSWFGPRSALASYAVDADQRRGSGSGARSYGCVDCPEQPRLKCAALQAPQLVTVSGKDHGRLIVWAVGDPAAALELSRGTLAAAQAKTNSLVHIACVLQGEPVPDETSAAVAAVLSVRTRSRLRHRSQSGPLPRGLLSGGGG